MSIRRRRYRRDPVPVGARLARYRRGAGGSPGSDLARLQAAWPEVAGRQAAGNSLVVRRSRAGVVSVACASGVWAQELDARRDSLADRLRRAVPDVQIAAIRFVVGDHVMPAAAAPTRPRPAPSPTADEIEQARRAVGDVSDPELRDLLARAAAGQMALRRAKTKSLQRGKKPGRVDRGG